MLNDREARLLIGLAAILISGASVRLLATRWPDAAPGVVLAPPEAPSGGTRPGFRGAAARDSLFPGGLLDVNAAGEGELVLLPGIGPALAGRVVDFRREHGPFRSVEELAQVRGIGPKTVEKLRPLVTAGIPR